jgi:hypothetical protein
MSTDATQTAADEHDLNRADDPVPAMLTRSLAAFRRDLPKLLDTHYGKWVAYHGDERLGFGKTETKLYEEHLAAGLKLDEFLVCSIEPEIADEDITWSSGVWESE